MARQRRLSAARSKANNGGLKRTQFAYREAAEYYRQAAALLPAEAEAQRAEYLNLQGHALYEAGDYRDAEGPFTQALALREQALGPEHPDVATNLNNLAGLHYAQGQYAKAEPLYQRALVIAEKALGVEHPTVAKLRKNYAASLRAAGRAAEAEHRADTSIRCVPAMCPSVPTSIDARKAVRRSPLQVFRRRECIHSAEPPTALRPASSTKSPQRFGRNG